jgi:hypothetical protein
MNMPMYDMKVERDDKIKAETETMLTGGPEYPYGLRICVDSATLKKLSLQKAPMVGQQMGLHALVEVVEVRLEDSKTGQKDISIELQIKQMVLQEKSAEGPANDPSKILYQQENQKMISGETLLGKG